MRACFTSFAFDSATRELRHDGEPLHISRKAFDLLHQLLEAAPRVVTKRDILDRVWAGTFVADGTLASVVTELRSVLGDDPKQPRFIRTVHGVGYSFCGEIASPEAQDVNLVYRLRWGSQEIGLSSGANVLGRDRSAVAWIDDPSISRRHAVVRVSDAEVTIEDLGSKNGTFVGGNRIRGRQPLADGDAVTLGRVRMTFRVFAGGLPTASVHST
jgi:DNA-binding winged helix-turn-helix (wHTH) protein